MMQGSIRQKEVRSIENPGAINLVQFLGRQIRLASLPAQVPRGVQFFHPTVDNSEYETQRNNCGID